jgi:hypothetical protein
MKKEIAGNNYYSISVDEEINRMYITMKGEWNKPSKVPNFIQDHEELIRHLKPGFTSLVDIKDMEPPSQDMLTILTKAVEMIEKAGMKRQAQIVGKASLEMIRKSRGALKESGADEKMIQFGSYEEAIEWLDR